MALTASYSPGLSSSAVSWLQVCLLLLITSGTLQGQDTTPDINSTFTNFTTDSSTTEIPQNLSILTTVDPAGHSSNWTTPVPDCRLANQTFNDTLSNGTEAGVNRSDLCINETSGSHTGFVWNTPSLVGLILGVSIFFFIIVVVLLYMHHRWIRDRQARRQANSFVTGSYMGGSLNTENGHCNLTVTADYNDIDDLSSLDNDNFLHSLESAVFTNYLHQRHLATPQSSKPSAAYLISQNHHYNQNPTSTPHQHAPSSGGPAILPLYSTSASANLTSSTSSSISAATTVNDHACLTTPSAKTSRSLLPFGSSGITLRPPSLPPAVLQEEEQESISGSLHSTSTSSTAISQHRHKEAAISLGHKASSVSVQERQSQHRTVIPTKSNSMASSHIASSKNGVQPVACTPLSSNHGDETTVCVPNGPEEPAQLRMGTRNSSSPSLTSLGYPHRPPHHSNSMTASYHPPLRSHSPPLAQRHQPPSSADTSRRYDVINRPGSRRQHQATGQQLQIPLPAV